MDGLKQVAPVIAAGLVPPFVYVAVVDVLRAFNDSSVALVAWAALAASAIIAWCGVDEYLDQREAIASAMARFGQRFVREFERPLAQPGGSGSALRSGLRARPGRRRLDVLLAPHSTRSYPNLSDHKTNVVYDVTRVMEALKDERFVCESLYSQGPWVVVPFRYQADSTEAGGQ